MIGVVRPLRFLLVGAILIAAAGSAIGAPPPDSAGAPRKPLTPLTIERDHGGGNRLLFTPDARPLGPGSGYVALHDLFIPSFAIGITGFFSVAAGASIVPGLDRQYVMVSPKIVPYAAGGIAIAAGLLYAARRGDEGAGIVFAEMTAGGGAGSGTFGLGWSFAGRRVGDGVDGSGGESGGPPGTHPVIIAAFRVPVTDGSEIISENWFPPNFDPALISIGWRISTGKVEVDLAACLNALGDAGGASLFPWISLAYQF